MTCPVLHFPRLLKLGKAAAKGNVSRRSPRGKYEARSCSFPAAPGQERQTLLLPTRQSRGLAAGRCGRCSRCGDSRAAGAQACPLRAAQLERVSARGGGRRRPRSAPGAALSAAPAPLLGGERAGGQAAGVGGERGPSGRHEPRAAGAARGGVEVQTLRGLGSRP